MVAESSSIVKAVRLQERGSVRTRGSGIARTLILASRRPGSVRTQGAVVSKTLIMASRLSPSDTERVSFSPSSMLRQGSRPEF